MGKLYKLFLIFTLCVQVLGVQSAWAQWVTDGVLVCSGSRHGQAPLIISDGAGGAILAWPYDVIRAQRIDAGGSLLWNMVSLCTGSCALQEFPLVFTDPIVSDGSGGAVITWQDYRNGSADIFAQRIGANGSIMWTANGVAVCTVSGDQKDARITSDGSGGAIIVWRDYDGGDIYSSIHAQRVNGAGSIVWGSGGVNICIADDNQGLPALIPDGSGGAIIVWYDCRNGDKDIYAQRVDANGAALWSYNGVAVCSASGVQDLPGLVSDGSGGAIVAWYDKRSGNADIYAQRIDANGTMLWTLNGIAVCTAGGDQEFSPLISDDLGGAIIVWNDYRSGEGDIYAQRIDANGTMLWTLNGVAICTASGEQGLPRLISDGSGGAIITWEDQRIYLGYDVYAQRVSAEGSVMWATNGEAICTNLSWQFEPHLAVDGSGGAIIAWQDYREGYYWGDIYAQRVDAAGHTVVATLLQNYAATFSETGITLSWTLSEIDKDAEFFIERSTASNGPFTELPSNGLIRNGLSFSFIDKDWEPNTSYWYQVGYSFGTERKMLFESGPVTTPTVPLTLYQNHPNPFNPSTQIRYYLPERCSVAFDIYDVNGAMVAHLTEGYQDKGTHTVSWDGRDRNGRQMSSGVYFYRLRAGKREMSKKMVLAR